jgi:hypothetical protein
MQLASPSDVFRLIAYDHSDARLEFLSALDCSFHCGGYLLGSFGASDATIFSKRGSPRSGSQKGNNFNAP